jgi:hypothetical protein
VKETTMRSEWVVMFTLPKGTTGRVARTFTEASANRYAERLNTTRGGDCRYRALTKSEYMALKGAP